MPDVEYKSRISNARKWMLRAPFFMNFVWAAILIFAPDTFTDIHTYKVYEEGWKEGLLYFAIGANVFFVLFYYVNVKGLRYRLTNLELELSYWSFVVYSIKLKSIEFIDDKNRTGIVLGLSNEKVISLKLKEMQYPNSRQKSRKEINICPVDADLFIREIKIRNSHIANRLKE